MPLMQGGSLRGFYNYHRERGNLSFAEYEVHNFFNQIGEYYDFVQSYRAGKHLNLFLALLDFTISLVRRLGSPLGSITILYMSLH